MCAVHLFTCQDRNGKIYLSATPSPSLGFVFKIGLIYYIIRYLQKVSVKP